MRKLISYTEAIGSRDLLKILIEDDEQPRLVNVQ
jgi:hypothetical protein